MTQIGFVGLGRMGGGIVQRIRRDSDHEVVAFDFDERAVRRAEKTGASGARSLKDLVKQLQPPRLVWIMVPAGAPTQETVEALAKLLARGDAIVDGGNSRWSDDKRRAAELKRHGIEYVDVGTPAACGG
jgi:6-phosphogluconate dehydrogenase